MQKILVRFLSVKSNIDFISVLKIHPKYEEQILKFLRFSGVSEMKSGGPFTISTPKH